MRVLVVSDTHRRLSGLATALERVKPDMLIHLGDVEGQVEEIKAMAGVRCEIIGGNNDYFSDLETEREIRLCGKKILLVHGHEYRVSYGREFLMRDAAARDIDVVLYGHTHIPKVEFGSALYNLNVIAVNPGSISYPRQEGRRPSFVLMDFDRFGEVHFNINYL